jgi:hypothetical protein
LRRELSIPKALTGVEEVLRWTGKVSTGDEEKEGRYFEAGF